MAQPIMESLLQHGKVARGWLGVALQDVTPELREGLGVSAEKGVLLSDVTSESPADKAGLKRGDIVLKLNGQVVDSSAKFRNVIAVAGPKARVSIDFIRNREAKQLTVTLGEKSAEGQVATPNTSDGRMGGLKLTVPTPELRRRYEVPPGVQGVIVTDVEVGSAAARAGFRPGDVVMELNRQAITHTSDFVEAYRRAPATVAALIYRQGNSLYLAFRK